MTKFDFADERDEQLVEDSFNYLAWIFLGKREKKAIEDVEKIFLKNILTVRTFEQNAQLGDDADVKGLCAFNEKNPGKLDISILGYRGVRTEEQEKFTKHASVHEFCHAFADIFPDKKKNQTRDGVIYSNQAGMVSMVDAVTKQRVKSHFYGKMFNETCMDIFSTIALHSYDPIFKGERKSTDEILKTHYSAWNDAETGYSAWTSLTRLFILAFANDPYVDYQKIIDNGESIILETSSINPDLKANDFLYGIICDPLSIAQQFDETLGHEGAFETVAHYLDGVFNKRKFQPEMLKGVMTVLSDFCNAKYAKYVSQGIMSEKDMGKLVSDYNRVFNSLQSEYGAFFNKEDIDGIEKRADKYWEKERERK